MVGILTFWRIIPMRGPIRFDLGPLVCAYSLQRARPMFGFDHHQPKRPIDEMVTLTRPMAGRDMDVGPDREAGGAKDARNPILPDLASTNVRLFGF